LDRAAIASFALHGHRTTLFSFDPVADPPPGVAIADAADIVPREAMSAFIYEGKPNLSHFSDYFRYRLFARTEHAWIDADLLNLRRVPTPADGMLFACETRTSLCGAIMRIKSDDPRLGDLLRRTEALMHRELVWGATGPRLLTNVFGARTIIRHAAPPETYFPIHYDDFFLPFLPEAAEICEELCRQAFTLHLWNNLVVQLGYWKDMAPPRGSWMWKQLQAMGLLSLFTDTYPAEVMRAMVTNWRFRKSGGDIGVVKLTQQIVPSIIRTARPRLRRLSLRTAARSRIS
jgi:hypothetical protein